MEASVTATLPSLALQLVIGVLLIAGGLAAINTAMIIGALLFSLVMALMGVSLVKAIVRDTIRDREADNRRN